MRRLLTLSAIALAIVASSCSKFDDTAIWDKLNEQEQTLNDHEKRIVALEELCRQLNTNIDALQTIVEALEKKDYVTNVSPVREDGEIVGYTISFANSDTITIYNGKDGVDGKDGYTPQIGVMKDTDGIYYWTVDGEWLLDGKDNKIKAIGEDGRDGQDGTNGVDGIDGIAPRLKIENDYWYVSYDGGATWTELGKASGEEDSIFLTVTQDDEYVYFNLADGTIITLPKNESGNIFISYIPRFCDDKVEIDYHSKRATLDFQISPKSAISDLAKNWQSLLSFKALYTQTRAVSYINLPITSFEADADNGTITIEVDGSSLVDDFYNGDVYASATLCFDDGKNEKCSSYVQLSTSFIDFECELVESICISQYDNNKDGKLSFAEAASVTSLYRFGDSIVNNGEEITSFDELKYFTGITSVYFANCYKLKRISLPSSVISIDGKAFYNCASLTSINIPDSVTMIGARAFYDCSNLTSISIPSSVMEIGIYAFSSCTSLTNIDISNGVTMIGEGAFYNCTSLTSINIPNSVTSIGDNAFEGCTGELTINSSIISKNFSSSGTNVFTGSEFNSVVIGEDIIAIGNYVFSGRNSIKRVNLPSNLISIGDYAFARCYNMEVYCAATTPPRIQSETFNSLSVYGSYIYVYVPRASESLYKSEWSVCESALIVGYDF